MVQGVRHTGIVVDDLNESLNFYEGLLGFTIHKQAMEQGAFVSTILDIPDVAVMTTKLEAKDGTMIELLDFMVRSEKNSQINLNSIGLTHVAFTVDNLKRLHEKLIRAGLDFISEPQISPDGYAKVAFCKAPEGTYIELVELLDNE